MDVIEDLGEPEGPVALPDGGWLVVEMSPDRGCVTRIAADGGRTVLRRTGRPNGLALAPDGTLWVAESGDEPAVLSLSLDGDQLGRITHVDGVPMLWPNDLCFGRDGMLYVTDSGSRPALHAPGGTLREDWATAPYDGRVYRIDPRSGDGTILDRGLRFANGIAAGPDGDLYVSETLTGNVYRYGASRELFGNVLDPDGHAGFRGPDGMAFSTDGRLWVAVFGQRDVTVLDRDGSVVERLRTRGANPANVAFGAAVLAVTDHDRGALELHPVEAEGLPLL